jgi:hypothetical protein
MATGISPDWFFKATDREIATVIDLLDEVHEARSS